ncbi:MAG TPA: molybdopterin converting factor subunit 1 [Phycisphaerales bacterium]|nr:molybdopterin converting factor subunit 1 [Phycisphaerales bacterium]HRQ75601.1 molybdopterin converting factor subunit 1 [Phycisphaerales bacterium]
MMHTIRCHVLLFAQLRESLGVDRFEIELPESTTVRDALERLAAIHEPIAAMRGKLAVAIDDRYAPMTEMLRDGAEIAIIPPVSGG